MVYISKVYTRTGDKGTTRLASGDEVSKASHRVSAYGEVDELNAVLGLVRLELSRDKITDDNRAEVQRIDSILADCQHDLFDLGAELASPGSSESKSKFLIRPGQVTALENEIDRLNEKLTPLKSFTLPGGGPTGAMAHLARTVCRRAERRAIELAAVEDIRPETIQYLNRLSDLLFVLSRAVATVFGHDEVLWEQDRGHKNK